jgi:Protein of unknown function (DUF3485)
VLILVGIGITLVTGVVCGRVSQRWGAAPDLVAAGAHLKSLPVQIGSWQLLEEEEMGAAEIQILSCAGYVNRKYIDRRTGDTVSLAIYVGPSGPIAVHTPEVCYPSRDYTAEGTRERVEFVGSNGTNHALWNTTFRSNNAIGERQSVFYGWLADEVWTASESPRFAFAGRPMLFKLQIAAPMPPKDAAEQRDPCRAFLQELLKSGWKAHG